MGRNEKDNNLVVGCGVKAFDFHYGNAIIKLPVIRKLGNSVVADHLFTIVDNILGRVNYALYKKISDRNSILLCFTEWPME